MTPTRLLAAAIAALVLAPVHTHALIRSCGPDAVANTEHVLCAPPSGPCDGATVVLSASVTVPDGACVFDLGGRALRVARTLETPGSIGSAQGGIHVLNVADVTIARGGRLKARGDMVRDHGVIGSGGRVEVDSAGTILVAGTIDVSGDFAGEILLNADGDVTFARSAKIRGNGISKVPDEATLYADGGVLEVHTLRGGIDFGGSVRLRGASGGSGGILALQAARDVAVHGKTDLSGGGGGGGDFDVYAADDVHVDRAVIAVQSRGGGDMGGVIDIWAGMPLPPDYSELYDGARPGGDLTIRASRFDLRGSGNDKGSFGAGGLFSAVSAGFMTIEDDVVIRADGAGSPEAPDGEGGYVSLDTYPIPGDDAVGRPPVRTDMLVRGTMTARDGTRAGYGGTISFFADRDLVIEASLDAGGQARGGDILMRADRHMTVRGPMSAAVDAATGSGGRVKLFAGWSEVGTLTIANDIRAGNGRRAGERPTVELLGCPVIVENGVTIDASTAAGSEGAPGASIAFFSGRPLELRADSQYLAGPGGTIVATHPPTIAPIVAGGTIFDPPPLLETVASPALFPYCPRCGAGPGDDCAPEVTIGDVTASDDVIDATAAATSRSGLPLSGTVDVCDGTGVEEVTFTWVASACVEPDTLELTINDTVVADVSDQIPVLCFCSSVIPIGTYTVPLDEARALLTPGANRFGLRKSGGVRSALAWAYATVTANGVAERIPIFDARGFFDPFGHSSFGEAILCSGERTTAAIAPAGETQLCNSVASAAWSNVLPCGLDLSALATQQDYTLLIRATDGAVAAPSVAARPFSRTEQPSLSLNGASCGGGS